MSVDQFLRILRARLRLILLTVAAVAGITAAVSLLLTPKYTATASIVIDFKALDPVSGNVLPAVLLPGYLATQMDIIASHNVALKVVDSLKLADDPTARQLFLEETQGKGAVRDWLADLLLKELKLDPSRESSMVRLSFRGDDPRFAAAVANAFVSGYISTNLELKVEPARQNAQWFDEQIGTLKQNLEQAQSRLSAFQRSKGIFANDERFDIENARLAELSTQVVGAQAQTFDSLSRQREVNEALARGGSPGTLPDVLNNPVIQAMRSALAQREGKLGELSGKVGRNHPAYRSALAEVDEIKRKLTEEMRAVSTTVDTSHTLAQSRESSLRDALAAQKKRVLDLKNQRDDAAVLLREVENAQRAYDAAMTRLTQTRMESQSTQTNISVINPAIEPILPSSPKIALNITVAFFLGILMAVGLALVAEGFDRIVRSREDLEAVLGVPVLGTIPRAGRKHGGGFLGLFARSPGPAGQAQGARS